MESLNKIRALYKGELFEKAKKKVLILIKLFDLLDSRFINYNITINNTFKIKNLDNITIPEELKNITLLNSMYTASNLLFNKNESPKKWFLENLSQYQDVKVVWELNRLQFLTQLSIIAAKYRVDSKIYEIAGLINQWVKQNSMNRGINWYSNLEVSIRSISLVFVNIFLYEDLDQKFIAKLLYQHGYHIYKDISYSERCIPNNHVIGEAAALYILSHYLNFNHNCKWMKKSKTLLEKYLKYFREDGTYLEASLSYHRFTLQMYILVYLFSRKYNDDFINGDIEKVILRSYTFLKSIEKPDESYPQFGDWDDGVFYKLSFDNTNCYKSFVDTLGYFCGINIRNTEIDILERIFGDISMGKHQVQLNAVNVFSEGKFAVLKENEDYIFFNNQDQIFHSHSDGLSLEIALNGVNITLDSGTYSYNTDKKMRTYFRSTKAHNTVNTGKDQAMQIGSFRWVNKPRTSIKYIKLWDAVNAFRGELEIKNGCIHTRVVLYDKNYLLIIDKLKEVKSNFIELNWHFAKGINPIEIENVLYSIDDSINLRLISDCRYNVDLAQSLYSASYNQIENRKNLKITIKNSEAIIASVFYRNVDPDIEILSQSLIRINNNKLEI